MVIPGGGTTPTTNVSFGSKAVLSSVIGKKLHAIVSEAGIVMSTEDGVKSIPPIKEMFEHLKLRVQELEGIDFPSPPPPPPQ